MTTEPTPLEAIIASPAFTEVMEAIAALSPADRFVSCRHLDAIIMGMTNYKTKIPVLSEPIEPIAPPIPEVVEDEEES